MKVELEAQFAGKGELIYREKKSGLVGAIPLFIALFGMMMFGMELKEGSLELGLLVFSALFAGIGIWIYILDQQIPAFYEHGILLYRKNKPVEWVPYSHVGYLDCYQLLKERYTDYGLEFHRQKGEIIAKLEMTQLYQLELIWKELLKTNPQLQAQLQPREARHPQFPGIDSPYFHNRTYEHLKG